MAETPRQRVMRALDELRVERVLDEERSIKERVAWVRWGETIGDELNTLQDQIDKLNEQIAKLVDK